MDKKQFKILSIDGGGIKGLYSASVLARIEEKTQKKITDYFDMICGTSTGGLIALGLSIGLPAQKLADIYFKQGNVIFPTSCNKYGRLLYRFLLRQVLFKSKFSNKALQNILIENFGIKTMGDADNLLCIPSFNLSLGMPRVFKFPHKEGDFLMDKNISMVDVALATTAAPTYLPIVENNNLLYVDGGVWANNPSLCGLLEALDYFVGEGKQFDSYKILSIASVSQPSGWTSTTKKEKSFLGWGNRLFQTTMDGQSYFTDFFLNKIVTCTSPKGEYYRIPSPKLSEDQIGSIQMDLATQKALKTLKGMGDHDGYTYAVKDEILEFFKTQKLYKTK